MTPARTALFEASLAAAQPVLMSHAMSKMRNKADAEECLSRTALKAWRAWPRYQDDNFSAWIHRILENEITSLFRQRKREERRAGEITQMGLGSSYPALQDTVVECRDLARAIGGLSPAYQHAVKRICIDGLSYADAAAEAHITVSTVKTNLWRARKRLVEICA